MDTLELKKEQSRLARRIQLRDTFSDVKTIGGVECAQAGDKLVAVVVVCEYPSMKFLEKKSAVLHNPLPYKTGYVAYREMPAIIDAFDRLEQEPDIVLVKGLGVNHPRGLGVASHVGLALNKPTIGVTDSMLFGDLEDGRIKAHGEILGFEIRTREYAKPVYVSPGQQVTLGSALQIVQKTIQFPHKMPEPLHLAHKLAKKKAKEMVEEKEPRARVELATS
ncbi:hypothetical protein COV20_01890 [Candidatus Woesearchaeota archaeon CG10_big_fil_rev_8_21_14_0_10_45_16]|nr:MAG: hypothetical protein COV20_01890 [Candidatus Woesearchaeota archaeon CG10_big_fil_rev_8_21_14_0_10_45_16]